MAQASIGDSSKQILEKLKTVNTSNGTDIVNYLICNDEKIELMKVGDKKNELMVSAARSSLRSIQVALWAMSKNLIKYSGILQFRDIAQYIGVLVGDNKPRSKMLPGVIQVCLLLFLFTTCNGNKIKSNGNVPDTTFEKKDDFVLVRSSTYKTVIVEFTEKFHLRKFRETEKFLDSLLEKAKSYKLFKEKHSRCKSIGYNPSLIDDINEVAKMAKEKKLTNLVLTHQELTSDNQFLILLKQNTKGEFDCYIDFAQKKVSYLLATNIFRLAPYYTHSLKKYRQKMVDSFYTDERQCLKEGVIYDHTLSAYTQLDYDLFIPVDEPGVERCSLLCESMNIKAKYTSKIMQLTTFNVSNENCDIFSYSLGNQTCLLKFRSKHNDLSSVERYNVMDKLTVTGNHLCRSKYVQGYPSIKVGKVVEDARKFCSFTSKSIAYDKKLYRCLGLYNLLSYPINEIKNQLNGFLQKLKLVYRDTQVKKRSLIPFLITSIIQAASTEGFSKIGIFPEQSIGSTLSLIGKALNSLNHYSRVVRKTGENKKISNNKLINSDISESYNKLINSDIAESYQIIFSNLQNWLSETIHFYGTLLRNTDPFFKNTTDFISNSSFVYSAFIKNDIVYRQFIKTEMVKIDNLTHISLVPISKKYFGTQIFWKSMISQNSNSQASICLINLLKNNVNKNELLSQCEGDNSLREKLASNVFSIPHKFGMVRGLLIVINTKSVFQIICKEDSLLDTCASFCVLAISIECKLMINGIEVKKNGESSFSFKPFVILNDQNILIETASDETIMEVNDIIQYGIFTSMLTLTMIFFCVLCCRNKIQCCNERKKEGNNDETTETMRFISRS